MKIERMEKEIEDLKDHLPSKKLNRQEYYEVKARIYQLRYEIEFKKSNEQFLCLNFYQGFKHRAKSIQYLNKRTEKEQKAADAWLKAIQKGKNPSPLDIEFINNGVRASFNIRI